MQRSVENNDTRNPAFR